MTSAYQPPLSSDYLFVKLLVRQNHEIEFIEKMSIVQDTIFRDKLGWRLVRAGKRRAPALPTDDEVSDDTHFEFLHLWQADNPINLWQGQVSVAQDSDYAALYRGVDREDQNILRLPPVYCPTAAFSEPAKSLLLVQEVKLVKDWSQAIDWQWKLPVPVGNGGVAPRGDFSLSFAFQTATGALRSHFHFFEADTPASQTLLRSADVVSVSIEGLDQPRDQTVDVVPPPRGTIVRDAAIRQRVKRGPVVLYDRVRYRHQAAAVR